MTLYQVTLPYLCAGLTAEAGVIYSAAPILHWTIGKRLSAVITWAERKGGTLRVVRESGQ